MLIYCDSPCAAQGLTSYRYRGGFGWIMIGARNTAEALSEAQRSTYELVTTDRLQVWSGDTYLNIKSV